MLPYRHHGLGFDPHTSAIVHAHVHQVNRNFLHLLFDAIASQTTADCAGHRSEGFASATAYLVTQKTAQYRASDRTGTTASALTLNWRNGHHRAAMGTHRNGRRWWCLGRHWQLWCRRGHWRWGCSGCAFCYLFSSCLRRFDEGWFWFFFQNAGYSDNRFAGCKLCGASDRCRADNHSFWLSGRRHGSGAHLHQRHAHGQRGSTQCANSGPQPAAGGVWSRGYGWGQFVRHRYSFPLVTDSVPTGASGRANSYCVAEPGSAPGRLPRGPR